MNSPGPVTTITILVVGSLEACNKQVYGMGRNYFSLDFRTANVFLGTQWIFQLGENTT